MQKIICTNQDIFFNTLKLGEGSDSAFSWDMIFNADIKMTLYSLDIIDSIIKTPTDQVNTLEMNLRRNWVDRFLAKGGFTQVAEEALSRLGVKWEPSKSVLDYQSGSTQIPANAEVIIFERFNRRIGTEKFELQMARA